MPGSNIPDTRGMLVVGKSPGGRIDLPGTGLPIFQQTMLAAGVVGDQLAAAGQQGYSGNE